MPRSTASAAVEGCTFVNSGGNALLLSRANAHASVTGCEFAFSGASAVLTAGAPDGGNASSNSLVGGDAPADTLIAGNLMRESGVVIKQAGPLYSVLSARTTFTGNVAFSTPRAVVNINDGAFGGHTISDNVMFGCVRETRDHGCVNTWDRERFIFGASGNQTLPDVTRISRNLIVSSYSSFFGIDHDDGSTAYVDAVNVIAWSGFKNYLGFNKRAEGNFFIHAELSGKGPCGSVAGTTCGSPGPSAAAALLRGRAGDAAGWPFCMMSFGQSAWPPAQRDAFANNTCVIGGNGPSHKFAACDASAPAADGRVPLLANNSYWLAAGARYELACGAAAWTLPQAQALGVELGSAAAPEPTPEAIDARARLMLGLAPRGADGVLSQRR